MPPTVHAFCARLLRYVYGEGQFDIDGDSKHKEATREFNNFDEQSNLKTYFRWDWTTYTTFYN
jgi:hypothetical protein